MVKKFALLSSGLLFCDNHRKEPRMLNNSCNSCYRVTVSVVWSARVLAFPKHEVWLHGSGQEQGEMVAPAGLQTWVSSLVCQQKSGVRLRSPGILNERVT